MPRRPGFRLVSANLRDGGADPEAFVRLVTRLEADVVAVQELAPEQADALAAVMPLGKLEPTRNHKGMGIVLREAGAVRPIGMWRLPLPCRDAWVAELVCTDAGAETDPVELLNVHFWAPHKRPFLNSLELRRGQLRKLEEHLDASPARRRVLIGDLNATPLWPVYRRLASRLRDAAVLIARRRGPGPRPTWGPWAGGPRLLRIDHALVNGVTADDVRTVPIEGSDHDALVLDLCLMPPA